MDYTVRPRINTESGRWQFHLDVQPPVGPTAALMLSDKLSEDVLGHSPWFIRQAFVGHEDDETTVFTVQYGKSNGNAAEDTPPQLDNEAFREFLTGSARALVELSGVNREVLDPVAMAGLPNPDLMEAMEAAQVPAHQVYDDPKGME